MNLRSLACAASALALGTTAALAQPPVSGMPFLDGNRASRSEAVTNWGGVFLPDFELYGWNGTLGKPQGLSVDPTDGGLNIHVLNGGTGGPSSGGAVTISGTLPAFAATPTINLGALNGAALAANQPSLNTDGGALAHVSNLPAQGTAGSPTSNVTTVQGALGGTPMAVSMSAPATGAATSANQTAVQAAAGANSTNAEGIQGVAGGVPVAVSMSAPASGAATSANQLGAANFVPGQTSVSTTAAPIVAARTGRRTVTVENTGTTPVYLGGSGVTASTGFLLPGVAGASLTISYAGALYGITSAGTAALTEYEAY